MRIAVKKILLHVVYLPLPELPKRKAPSAMQETALVRDVIHRIEDLARGMSARRVAAVKVWLGALSHLSAEHFREHFTIEAKGTLAAGAVLDIEVSQDPADPNAQHQLPGRSAILRNLTAG
jgi:hydrogenase nickel incorporation protein HypA/HybF